MHRPIANVSDAREADRLERRRIAARERWIAWQREKEIEERLAQHRALAFGGVAQ